MIHTETIDIEKIIQRIEDKNDLGVTENILIVGCAICANISCGANRGGTEPTMSLSLRPIPLEAEIERISSELRKKYKSVDFMTIKGLCSTNARTKRKMISKAENADTIIVLSCPSGMQAVQTYFDDRKLIMGMRVKGFQTAGIKLTRKGIFFT